MVPPRTTSCTWTGPHSVWTASPVTDDVLAPDDEPLLVPLPVLLLLLVPSPVLPLEPFVPEVVDCCPEEITAGGAPAVTGPLWRGAAKAARRTKATKGQETQRGKGAMWSPAGGLEAGEGRPGARGGRRGPGPHRRGAR